MRKIIISLLIITILSFRTSVFGASDFVEVQNRVTKVQTQTITGPNAPAGMDKTGYVGVILSRIFDATGRIKNEFIIAFQSIQGNYINTLLKWDGQKFVAGTITDTGRIGINTASPGVGYILDINGNTNIRGNVNVTGDFYKDGNIYSGGKFLDGIDVRDAVYSGGSTRNVGIGTNTPTEKLDVRGNIKTTGRQILFGTLDQKIVADNNSAFYLDSNNSSTNQLIFRDKEDVNYGRVMGSNDGALFGLIDGDGNWSLLNYKDDYTAFRINNLEKMRIQTNGNVGIGETAPAAKLQVSGSIAANDIGDSNFVQLWQDNAIIAGRNGSLDRLRFGFADGLGAQAFSEKMTITDDGNVGIGTTIPSEKLQVNGTGKFTKIDTNEAEVKKLKVDDVTFDSTGNSVIFTDQNTAPSGVPVCQCENAGASINNCTVSQQTFNTKPTGYKCYTQGSTIAGFYYRTYMIGTVLKIDSKVEIGSDTEVKGALKIGGGIITSGKIRMNSQTQNSDFNDTVTTKGYVDNNNIFGGRPIYVCPNLQNGNTGHSGCHTSCNGQLSTVNTCKDGYQSNLKCYYSDKTCPRL